MGQDGMDIVILARRGAGSLSHPRDLVTQSLERINRQAIDGRD